MSGLCTSFSYDKRSLTHQFSAVRPLFVALVQRDTFSGFEPVRIHTSPSAVAGKEERSRTDKCENDREGLGENFFSMLGVGFVFWFLLRVLSLLSSFCARLYSSLVL